MRELIGHTGIVLGVGLVLLTGTVAFLRWFLKKPRKVALPMHLVEEMSRFAEELRRVEDNVDAVTKALDERGRRRWRRTSRKMLKRLRSVNRLLERLNMMFEEEQARIIVRQRRRRPLQQKSPAPAAKNREGDSRISEEEIRNIDWDDFIGRAAGE